MWLTRSSGESDESVEIAGERFLIGRDPTCNLALDDEKVSRQHSVIEVESDGRTLIRDLDSSNGTFVDGSRIGSPVELKGGEKIRVGDTTLMASEKRPAAATVVASSLPPPQAAEPQAAERQVGRSTVQRIVAAAIAGEERKIRREVIIAGGLGILGVVAAATVGALFAAGTIGGASHRPSVASLERATVLIQYQQGNLTYIGSGSIIRRDGLILTNAHVAAPYAPGLDVQYGTGTSHSAPRLVTVAFFQGEAKPAKPIYLARPVVYDGYLDVAVLKVVKRIDGKPLSHLNLPTVPIGDSNAVRDGEQVSVIGYPGVGGGFEGEINVSAGSISGFQRDARLATPRGWIKTDAAIAHGNSGGLAADPSGHLIGIPSRIQCGASLSTPCTPGEDTQGKIRPVALALPLIRAAESGGSWTTPYVVNGTGKEQFRFVHWAKQRPDNSCHYDSARSYPSGTSAFYAVFDARGLAPDEDLLFMAYDGTTANSLQPYDQNQIRWFKTGGSSDPCYWFSFGTQDGDGYYAVQVYAGPYLKPVSDLIGVQVGSSGG